MTEQHYPPPGQDPFANLVPPKPTAEEQSYGTPAPQPLVQQNYQQSGQQPYQQPPQQGDPLSQMTSDQVYPTPPPEHIAQPVQQYYQQAPYQPYQQPQQPDQQPQQQPYQQNAQGQPTYPLPVQPAQPGVQDQSYQQGGQPYQQPQQGVPQQQPQQGEQPYQQPYQQQGYYQQPQPYQQGGSPLPFANNYLVFLILSILALIFCAWPFAIPAIVYAVSMNKAYKRGNAALYEKSKRLSRVWLIVSAVVAVILYLFIFASSAAGNGFSGYY